MNDKKMSKEQSILTMMSIDDIVLNDSELVEIKGGECPPVNCGSGCGLGCGNGCGMGCSGCKGSGTVMSQR